MKKVNCSATNAARPYEDVARYGEDSFSSVNCHASYDMVKGGVNARGFTFATVGTLTSRPLFSYDGCTVDRVNENIGNLANTTTASAAADVGSDPLTSSPCRVVINDLKHTKADTVYLRVTASKAHNISVDDVDLSIHYAGMPGGSLQISPSCTVRSLRMSEESMFLARLSGCRVLGQVSLLSENTEADGVSVDIDSTEYVWFRSNKTGNYPAVDITGAKFKKDINANGAVLRLGFGTAPFTTIMTGVRMYNKGSPSASNPFVRYAAGSVRQWSSTFADNTVTNITQLDSGGGNETTLTGVTKIAMH